MTKPMKIKDRNRWNKIRSKAHEAYHHIGGEDARALKIIHWARVESAFITKHPEYFTAAR